MEKCPILILAHTISYYIGHTLEDADRSDECIGESCAWRTPGGECAVLFIAHMSDPVSRMCVARNDEKLEPCLHCGGRGKLEYVYKNDPLKESVFVMCHNCFIRTRQYSCCEFVGRDFPKHSGLHAHDLAIADWNRRAGERPDNERKCAD